MTHPRFFVRLIWLLAITSLVFSCSDDDTPTPEIPSSALDGYFIVNEGGFGNANTSLSYYDRTNDTILNNVFEQANSRPLGDQTQSMTVIGERGFIVVQNSAKIEVINTTDFTSIATITEGIVSPRYLIGVSNNKAYVTDWGADGISGTVKAIDLTSYEVTATVPVGEGPNGLVLINDEVYVANGGGFGHDSTLMVLNVTTDTVTDTIVVGDNPSSLAVDAGGDLWVAGGGLIRYADDFSIIEEESTPGFIVKLEDGEIARRLTADQISAGPSGITTNAARTDLYFRYSGGVHRIPLTATELPSQPLIDQNFYGLGVDPVSGEILGGEAPNFSSDGTFSRYSATGELIKTYTVGIAPNGFAF